MSARRTLDDELMRRMLELRASRHESPEVVAATIARDCRTVSQTGGDRPRTAELMGRFSLRAIGATIMATALVLVGAVVIQLPAPEGLLQAGGPDAPAMAAGRYRTSILEPALTFTVPDGIWSVVEEDPDALFLRAHLPGLSPSVTASLTIMRIDDVAGGPGDVCGYVSSMAWPARPGGARELMSWLASRLPLDLGEPVPKTVAGQPAWQVDLKAPETLTQSCDFGLPLTRLGTAEPPRYVDIPVDGRQVRLIAVDIDGTTVGIIIDADVQVASDALDAAAAQLLASIATR